MLQNCLCVLRVFVCRPAGSQYNTGSLIYTSLFSGVFAGLGTGDWVKKKTPFGALSLVMLSGYILNPTVSIALPPVDLMPAPEKLPVCKR